MEVKVKLTKQNNALYYGVPVNTVVAVSLREYLRGVVASEIGNAPIEACKAQAIASRTFVWRNVLFGTVVSDSSSSAQCFNIERVDSSVYATAHRAVDDTEGIILCYNGKPISPCSFSASNGGRTTSSQARWGSHRPYLIEQDDPWDYAITQGKKRGHGVGMSQKGAMYAAKAGYSYRDILSFYYPGTVLVKEESPMATVKASDLVHLFNQMADEKWKYVAGAHREGEVDCSGAFYYAYKKLGGYMYHGSNTMWRKYTVKRGKIGEMELLPGMAVFKRRDWTAAQSANGWYETDPGDVYHVGLYVGDGWVVEAKGTKYGVVKSKIDAWHLAAKLKDTTYDSPVQDDRPSNHIPVQPPSNSTQEGFPFTGVAAMDSGYLNLRVGPAKTQPYYAKVYDGDRLNVIGETGNWYIVEYSGKKLYASKDFVVRAEDLDDALYLFTVEVKSEQDKQNLECFLRNRYAYSVNKHSVA